MATTFILTGLAGQALCGERGCCQSVWYRNWKLSFRHIEVRNNASGAPELFLSDYGLELQQQRGVKRLHLSLSDEQDNAIAFVVLES